MSKMSIASMLQAFRSNIQAMDGYVAGEQPPAGKYIKLNTNENPYPPSTKIVGAVQQAMERGLQFYPDPLATAFRLRAADLWGFTPDHFLCGNGSDDLLTIMTRAFVGEGDCLRLPYPSYILYRSLAELQSARFEQIRFNDDFVLSEDFGRLSPNTKLVFLPNPNSPSGTRIAKSQLRELASQMTCPLVIDEAYVDFAKEDCLDLVREFPHVMVTRTLSKSYGLAGLRFGFAVGHPDVIRMLRKVKDSYNCDALSIAAATAAIDDQEWLQANRSKVIATRTRMTARLRQIGFHVQDSEANFVWCTWPGRELKPLYEQLKAQHVLVRYMQYEGWGEGLRVSVGTDPQTDAALDLLEGLL